MKWHPVIAGFIPNPRITYRVEDGYATTTDWFKGRQGSIRLAGAEVFVGAGD
jgi:hypothetical protein